MTLASIELVAERDVERGQEVTIEELFPWQDYDEVTKVFDLSGDVAYGQPIVVMIAGLSPLRANADIGKKQGQRPRAGLWMMLAFPDLRTPLTALAAIRKGDVLRVTIEPSK